jgi:hypothetical protein
MESDEEEDVPETRFIAHVPVPTPKEVWYSLSSVVCQISFHR